MVAHENVRQIKEVAREVSAGIIIYRRTKEGVRFLLVYQRGRYWNFPKGKLNLGEKSLDAAFREVKEEIGLSARDLRLREGFNVKDRFVFMRAGQKVFKEVTFYLAETRNPIVRTSFEHQGYGWFLYRDAMRMLIHANLRQMLKNAYDIIRRKSVPYRPWRPQR